MLSGMSERDAREPPLDRIALDPPEAQQRRLRLVEELIALGDAQTAPVIEALRRVPRHLFIPEAEAAYAYDNVPLHIGDEQTISQPTIVAVMTEALALTPRSRVLEIGTGSAYQAAVLSLIAQEVYSIERIPRFAREASERLRRLGYAGIEVRFGDGYAGWPERAPFDRILLTAAPPMLPTALLDQLVDGGVLVAPVGAATAQELVRIHKQQGRLRQESLGAVRFVPMLAGALSRR
ncbi:protein-L-isoaspartate O-methyltransferase [Chondromyces crocatus]|uniref:Protein-L-isoaspartate O-methyltransferase n=2 Tax=Chondromyces crocatus TaxID=52 RepID=A0A0K1ELW1_CHOCO|nr:protein-L-isoaspartate O-methyltransferase [Chondromyces crocatus]